MSFLTLKALRVRQPLCDFFLVVMSAKDLIEISFSEQLQYIDEAGQLKGSQRLVDRKRLTEIGKYIDSVEMSFPNSIIIAANYDEAGNVVEDDNLRWQITDIGDGLSEIRIPTNAKLAAVIDGQHRLQGFGDKYIKHKDRLNTELPVAVFFDLSNPYQAFLFATINGNQKRVDKSLALEQFGFNVEDEPQKTWTPEKLAVYFTRKLNFSESPLHGHIRLAPQISKDLRQRAFQQTAEWTISTATIVDGILRLITSNAKRDRVEMAHTGIWEGRSRSMVAKINDKAPLRDEYLHAKDDFIYEVVHNYVAAVKETLWSVYSADNYIFKTVGVLALFDLLKRIEEVDRTASFNRFVHYLAPSKAYDFAHSSIQASGIGRKDIRNALLLASGLIESSSLREEDLAKIKALQRREI